ncbi:MAG: C25 family cysteine peptidase, partial [Candidatus Krumholzibacteria bacterium]|nr:C25 family cysteine peptidase [Candidatus Krumholzibacteria bacterium]
MTYRLPTRPFVLPVLLVAAVLLSLGSAGAAPVAQTQWSLADGDAQIRNLTFRLPSVKIHEVQVEGKTWQTLEIDGAAEHGSMGEPGIPVTSHLVAVPAGMTLSVSFVSATSSPLHDLNLLPVQDPATESFAFTAAAYTQKSAAGWDEPRFQVGEPAIIAGQTVVSLTIHPVSYNPGNREAVLWTDVTLQLEFVSDPQAPLTTARTRPIPLSFARQLSTQALGYESPVLEMDEDATSGLGTYAAVHNGSATVMSGISDLLKWRREQGYHVVEVNTGTVGGSNAAIKSALRNIYFDENLPQLEFITIIGDVGGDFPVPSWIETLSGYQGGGDHYYTTLDGDDILADVHVGRISVRDANQLATVVEKILSSEISPPMDDT